ATAAGPGGRSRRQPRGRRPWSRGIGAGLPGTRAVHRAPHPWVWRRTLDTPGPQRASGPSCCTPPARKAPRMSLHGLLDAVVKDTALAEAISAASDGSRMHVDLVGPAAARPFAVAALAREDRKSTRLNSSHVKISYAVFCLK